MKVGFTEFSYGHAFTENLISRSACAPAAAPFFPNLVDEGQLGFDVRVNLPGVALFFQFKLPDLMMRRNTREIRNFAFPPPGLSVPYFRMPLMPRNRSNQHADLIDLEKHHPNSVFYASTKNANISSFNDAYAQTEVHLQSVLFSPIDIGELLDDEEHSVAYYPFGQIAWRCSKPREVKAYTFDAIAAATNKTLAERIDFSLEETTNEIREKVWPIISPRLTKAEPLLRERIEARFRTATEASPIDDRARSVLTDLLILRELVRVNFGCDLLIAQPHGGKKR